MTPLPTDKPFRDTDRNLRELLDTLYATNDIYTFDELKSEIAARIVMPLHFLIYVRDHSWFNDSHFLIFKYLSFEFDHGALKSFSSKDDIEELEKQLIGKKYRTKESSRCRLLFQPDCEMDTERLENLLMRIVVAFYTNCGHHDHVRNSVSQRFIREFFKSKPTSDVKHLLAYLNDNIGLTISLWQPKDEMYFAENQQRLASDLLRPFHNSEAATSPLPNDIEFARDLRTSVRRLNQTSGLFAESQTQYVIRTFSVSRLLGDDAEPWSRYKLRRTAVAIFQSQSGERIALDRVFHASRVIEEYLNAFDELKVTNVLLNAEARCLKREIKIAESPIHSASAFSHTYVETISSTIDEAVAITLADRVCVWLYDPFDKALKPFLVRQYGSQKAKQHDRTLTTADSANHDINVETDDVHLLARCFRDRTVFSLQHPLHIESDKAINITAERPSSEDRARRAQAIDSAEAERRRWRNSGESQECACLTIPIRRGGVVMGVLEVVSREVGELTFDITLLERVASICGETFRRLELANDRAWLARMSFVYACRHRVEELLREIKNAADNAGRELAAIIEGARVSDSTHTAHSNSKWFHQIEVALKKCCGDHNKIHHWLGTLRTIISQLPADRYICELVAEITDALVANRSHSNFEIDCFTLRLVSGHSHEASYLEVQYEPPDIWLDREKMDQIGISPIKDILSNTYHYGLFLLSAQVRMIGGIAQARTHTNLIGCRLFGLSFRIPVLGSLHEVSRSPN